MSKPKECACYYHMIKNEGDECLYVEKSAYAALEQRLALAVESLNKIGDVVGHSERKDVPIIYKIIRDTLAGIDQLNKSSLE